MADKQKSESEVEISEQEYREHQERVKELTLLLLYLTSWEEKDYVETTPRSWKGYSFDALNELTDEEYLYENKRAKSVYLTKKGVDLAKELEKKYLK
jgi:hypothetical protein